MKEVRYVVMGLACLSMLACSDSRGGGTGGDTTITVHDGGSGDTGSDRNIGLMDDGTSGTDATSNCPPMSVPPVAAPACAAATLTCLQGAMTEAAAQACIDADPAAAACNNCLSQDLLACATAPAGGCAQVWGNLDCCGSARCAGLTGNAAGMCSQSMCPTEFAAVVSCLQTAPCRGFTNCFP